MVLWRDLTNTPTKASVSPRLFPRGFRPSASASNTRNLMPIPSLVVTAVHRLFYCRKAKARHCQTDRRAQSAITKQPLTLSKGIEHCCLMCRCTEPRHVPPHTCVARTWSFSRSSVRQTDVLEAVVGSTARFLIQSRSAQNLSMTLALSWLGAIQGGRGNMGRGGGGVFIRSSAALSYHPLP